LDDAFYTEPKFAGLTLIVGNNVRIAHAFSKRSVGRPRRCAMRMRL